MYTVHLMKTYGTAEAREHLSDLLSEAEEGQPVFIERRGVRFKLELAPQSSKRAPAKKTIEILDRDVASGNWSFDMAGRFRTVKARPGKRPK